MAEGNQLWQLRAAAWRDRRLSGNATKLFLLLTDRFYKTLRHGEEFPFSSQEAATMLKLSKWHSGHAYVLELIERGYLLERGRQGCPATYHYIFSPSLPVNRQSGSPVNRQSSLPVKGAHHISISLREEMKGPMGRNSSLRSTGTKGGKDGSLRSRVSDEKLRQCADGLKKFRESLK
ncbi:MAG: hypothetical protein MUF81_06660 [Verrucomicrobia bacterium]|jgi:hypothetical protein|nr:hypothetical protein [Verrucomicrobiota bacterium]